MSRIFWSPTAKETYAAILRYVMDNYPIDVAIKMDDKVERVLSLLEQNKQLCRASSNLPGVRRCVITKHLSMAYRIKDDDIEIVAFFDNRADLPF